MGIIKDSIEALRFKDTIFYKDTCDLQLKYEALDKLQSEFKENKELLDELNIVKAGLYGENQIAYQLKKANIGMYVLRDVKVKFEDLTAQIDYIIITPVYTYYVECKNLIGNITITDKGEFIREIETDGKKVKKGMYSPLRQVEAQREVIRKIWEKNTSKIIKLFSANYFDYYKRVLVIITNPETIINMDKAPKTMKYKVLRADSLVKQIEYDINHRNKDDIVESKKSMEDIAKSYLSISVNDKIDYYDYYKNKFNLLENTENSCNLKEKLLELRKKRSNQYHIPAYYIFNNEELEKIISIKPSNIEELYKSNILPKIKIEKHGVAILNVINEGDDSE